ncbi:hypothetical protein FHS29_002265 [Saccharothrix tamanrassetensis]|uniref:ATPase AAA-type core domain-containing protein n=1 Tax=Saccharothrix tamanrassetensis TaxID=1051531 RepID=A0A841CH43_9PSEU|nr:ATP-binding protein [Saccharothrix tamanrassetensis]MBB5955684.1 hypothetical protein [Saccharothrix tamanrassetensis]
MLRSFRLSNHRSFRDEQELSLIPAYARDPQAVPVVAIYGANASGKSNLLDGLSFMAEAVRDSFGKWSPTGGIPRRPFRLDRSSDRPSAFVAELVEGGVRYVYGFEVDDERVRSEWLYSYPEKRKRVVFEREVDEMKFGTTVGDARAKLEVLEGMLRPNSLFLSLAGQASLTLPAAVHRWFTEKLVFRLTGLGPDEMAMKQVVMGDASRRRRFADLVKAADLGVSALVVSYSHPLPAAVEAKSAQNIDIDWDIIEEALDDVVEDPGERRHLLSALRRALDADGRIGLRHGGGEVFGLNDESAGTRAWLGLLPVALAVLENGGALVVDEIDASLHPQLTARLVALFRDPDANPAAAQLVFTTHDASLLSPALGEQVLERDEIWFVQKDQDGVSELYPLTDFHPRKEGENLERRYLGGSYGAVPNLMSEDFVVAVRGRVGADDPA